MTEPHTPFLQETRSKVIAAFLLAFSGITLALSITYFSFHELMGTVDELSEPNKKLRSLNELFRAITRLDQYQRAELLKNPEISSKKLITKSNDLLLKMDSLKMMPWQNEEQVQRITRMEEIMQEHDRYFVAYLQLKYKNGRNKPFLQQLDSLSEALSGYTPLPDTAIISKINRTVTTRYLPDSTIRPEQRSFFGKLFKRKKAVPAEEPKVRITQELISAVDTIPIVKSDSVLYQVSQVMKILNNDERLKNRKMLQRELKLVNVNTALLNELLSILHEVEAEEVNQLRKNNEAAAQFVNISINRIVIFLTIFFLLAALLLFLILIDIAKSNYYRAQLLKAKEEAEHLSQVKQRFLANMSHEIRTPLQSIIGFAEQLENNKTEAVEAIQKSSGHLLHIVNEVLDYSRIESGKLKFTIESFSMGKVLHEVLAGIRIQATQKDLAVVEDIRFASEQLVLGDAFRMKQILYNVLSNAVKFTPRGYVKLQAEQQEEAEDIRYRLTVSDSGIGMSPDDIDRVFHQFEQANASISNTFGGTGLGLTIVKALIDAQDGTLNVESEPEIGSTFTIKLTFKKSHDMLIRQDEKISQNGNRVITGEVIVVDDDPLILSLCSLIFRKHDIVCHTFQQPEHLLIREIKESVSHIFLDIRMPHIDGTELCREIRRQCGNSLTIIALTAHALQEEQEALLQAGFDEVLPKPFREADLLNVVSRNSFSRGSITTGAIDFSILTQMTSGDDALLASVIEQFVKETEQELDRMSAAVGKKDHVAVADILHKLSGRIGQMGGLHLAAVIRRQECNVRDHPLERAVSEPELNSLVQEIRLFQATLSGAHATR